jgi:hypothetical protein
MKEKHSNKNIAIDNQDYSSDKSKLKEWKAPKLQIENTNNTLGGTTSTNAPGDDSWYVS